MTLQPAPPTTEQRCAACASTEVVYAAVDVFPYEVYELCQPCLDERGWLR